MDINITAYLVVTDKNGSVLDHRRLSSEGKGSEWLAKEVARERQTLLNLYPLTEGYNIRFGVSDSLESLLRSFPDITRKIKHTDERIKRVFRQVQTDNGKNTHHREKVLV